MYSGSEKLKLIIKNCRKNYCYNNSGFLFCFCRLHKVDCRLNNWSIACKYAAFSRLTKTFHVQFMFSEESSLYVNREVSRDSLGIWERKRELREIVRSLQNIFHIIKIQNLYFTLFNLCHFYHWLSFIWYSYSMFWKVQGEIKTKSSNRKSFN